MELITEDLEGIWKFMKCKECGTEIKPEESVCPICKTKISVDDRVAEMMTPEFKKEFRKSALKRRIIATVIVIFVLVVINNIVNGGKNNYIDLVKNGSMSEYGTTVNDILNQYYDNIKWSHRETDGGVHIVTAAFRGTYMDAPADYKVNFTVDEKEETFYLDSVIVNDEENILGEIAFSSILQEEE